MSAEPLCDLVSRRLVDLGRQTHFLVEQIDHITVEIVPQTPWDQNLPGASASLGGRANLGPGRRWRSTRGARPARTGRPRCGPPCEAQVGRCRQQPVAGHLDTGADRWCLFGPPRSGHGIDRARPSASDKLCGMRQCPRAAGLAWSRRSDSDGRLGSELFTYCLSGTRAFGTRIRRDFAVHLAGDLPGIEPLCSRRRQAQGLPRPLRAHPATAGSNSSPDSLWRNAARRSARRTDSIRGSLHCSIRYPDGSGPPTPLLTTELRTNGSLSSSTSSPRPGSGPDARSAWVTAPILEPERISANGSTRRCAAKLPHTRRTRSARPPLSQISGCQQLDRAPHLRNPHRRSERPQPRRIPPHHRRRHDQRCAGRENDDSRSLTCRHRDVEISCTASATSNRRAGPRPRRSRRLGRRGVPPEMWTPIPMRRWPA